MVNVYKSLDILRAVNR